MSLHIREAKGSLINSKSKEISAMSNPSVKMDLGVRNFCYGKFRCTRSNCGRTWESPKTWKFGTQECIGCHQRVKAHDLEQLYIYQCWGCGFEWVYKWVKEGLPCRRCHKVKIPFKLWDGRKLYRTQRSEAESELTLTPTAGQPISVELSLSVSQSNLTHPLIPTATASSSSELKNLYFSDMFECENDQEMDPDAHYHNLGQFRCANCGHLWKSATGWYEFVQKCAKCQVSEKAVQKCAKCQVFEKAAAKNGNPCKELPTSTATVTASDPTIYSSPVELKETEEKAPTGTEGHTSDQCDKSEFLEDPALLAWRLPFDNEEEVEVEANIKMTRNIDFDIDIEKFFWT